MKKRNLILAILFSFFTIFGESFKITSSWAYLLNNIGKSIIIFISCIPIYYLIMYLIDTYLSKYIVRKTNNRFLMFIFDKNPILKISIILFIFYLPYLILKYPGTPGWDYHWMIKYYLENELSVSYPLFFVQIVVIFYKIGNTLTDNIGLFLFVLLQTSYIIFSISMVFKYFKKWNINYWIRLIVLIFYCVNPLFGHYTTTIYHDMFYTCTFILYTLLITDLVNHDYDDKKLKYFILVSLLLCLFRRNGIYIIIPTTIFLFKYKISKKVLLKPIIYYFAILIVLLQFFYANDGFFEAVTLPAQAVSRYSYMYHDDISEHDLEVVNSLIDYEEIGLRPYTLDLHPLYNYDFDYKLTSSDVKEFVQTWIRLGLKHPDAYIQGIIKQNYVVFYPYENITQVFYYPDMIFDFDVEELDLTYKRSESQENIINWVRTKGYSIFRSIPVLRYIMEPAIYVWILLFMIAYTIGKKKKKVVMIPLIVSLLFCIVAPALVTHTRIAFPIIYMVIPTLIYFYSPDSNFDKNE